jgi:DNA-binding response OmpR family regulator
MADRQRTILVVEEDGALRQVLADALQMENYRVIQASNAADGLEIASSEHPDLVLLDLSLPGRSGIEFLKDIKCAAPTREIPVLIMGGYALLIADGAVRQADGTVAKPFDLTRLLESVDLLSSRQTPTPSGTWAK